MITAKEAATLAKQQPLLDQLESLNSRITTLAKEGYTQLDNVQLLKESRQILVGAGYTVTMEPIPKEKCGMSNGTPFYKISWS
jgi:hypothetical protein